MTSIDNAYAAFMLDFAAGALSPGERLAAELHRELSVSGSRNVWLWETIGACLLEQSAPSPVAMSSAPDGDETSLQADERTLHDQRLRHFLQDDLMALPWRKSLFGVKTLSAGLPLTSLLRLDPGERTPRHAHGRRDVTVVLCGSFADEYGVNERGDLAFAEPGLKHQPRAVGDRSCVCLLATEPGRPMSGFLGAFGLMG